MDKSQSSQDPPANYFPQTRWSLFQEARSNDNPRALEDWCKSYWTPIHGYVCSRGYNSQEADDLTQGFFQQLLSRTNLGLPETLQGNLRAFLKRSVKNFISNQWRKESAQKRGSGQEILQIEEELVGTTNDEIDVKFARDWLTHLTQRATDGLKQEMGKSGKLDAFEVMMPLIVADGSISEREEMAAKLEMDNGAFRVALHRLRKRYRTLLENEIRETVSTEEEYQEELKFLFSVW